MSLRIMVKSQPKTPKERRQAKALPRSWKARIVNQKKMHLKQPKMRQRAFQANQKEARFLKHRPLATARTYLSLALEARPLLSLRISGKTKRKPRRCLRIHRKEDWKTLSLIEV